LYIAHAHLAAFTVLGKWRSVSDLVFVFMILASFPKRGARVP